MFKIYQNDDNGNGIIKPHFISSVEIVDEIMLNLEERFGEIHLRVESDENICFWDPGGIMIEKDAIHSFFLSNIIISCRAQHLKQFIVQVNKRQPRGKNIKYIKLHTYCSCICISVEEFCHLKELLQDDDLLEDIEEAENKRSAAIDNLFHVGKIAKKVIDENGNIKYLINKQFKDQLH